MSAFDNATLMITGGTGSFGSTVLKHFLDSDLKEIRIFSRDEKKQDDMRHELQAKHPDAAKKVNGAKVIGVDVDQAGVIAKYAAGEGADQATIDGFKALTVTSAMKGLYPATFDTLTDVIVKGNWDNYKGKIQNLGLVSGDDPTLNYVQIPMESTQWKDGAFTQDNYKAMVKEMFDGTLTVSNDITKAAKDFATVITVDDQGKIKG